MKNLINNYPGSQYLQQELAIVSNKQDVFFASTKRKMDRSKITYEGLSKVCINQGGVIPRLDEKALPARELAKRYDLIDFENTGSDFSVYKGMGYDLHHALIKFFTDSAQAAGYQKIESSDIDINVSHLADKIEIGRINNPGGSYQSLQEMLHYIETLFEKLELPWRTLHICGGDLNVTPTLNFDMEVYSAIQKCWYKVCDISSFESFQGNNPLQESPTFHESTVIISSVLATLLENKQTAKGIFIPAALSLYTKFSRIK